MHCDGPANGCAAHELLEVAQADPALESPGGKVLHSLPNSEGKDVGEGVA